MDGVREELLRRGWAAVSDPDKAVAILDSGHSGPVKKAGCGVARGQRIRGPFVHELAGLLVFEPRRAGRWADSAICWPLLVKNAGSVWPVFRSSKGCSFSNYDNVSMPKEHNIFWMGKLKPM